MELTRNPLLRRGCTMMRASKVLVVGILGLIWASAAFSQDVSSQLISAQSGHGELFRWKAHVIPRTERRESLWCLRDQLRAGDRVRLDDSERMEIPLEPGQLSEDCRKGGTGRYPHGL